MSAVPVRVFMGQDNAARMVGIVYGSVVADGGALLLQVTVKDGDRLAVRMDAALAREGVYRSGGFRLEHGDLVAAGRRLT